jgi:S-formylglutathione hydrolase FrmB
MTAQAITAGGLWLDGDDWCWPGARAEARELGPPAWIPALPQGSTPESASRELPRIEAASAESAVITRRPPAAPPAAVALRFDVAPPAAAPRRSTRPARWRITGQRLVACGALVLVFAGTFELAGRLRAGDGPATVAPRPTRARAAAAARPRAVASAPVRSPVAPGAAGFGPLVATASVATMSRDGSGASIARVRFTSTALRRRASFLVYLPPGYRAGTATRYPVLYLLHGDNQLANAWLQLGFPDVLDTVIDNGEVQPLIAVMPEGARFTENWRNIGSARYEDYLLETQQLADRLLPTVPNRAARGIIGFSMGGYGAMHAALDHLDRFSVVESWLGFFDHLGPQLQADAARIKALPLTAYMYGAAQDTIADPGENAPFAAALRAAGATAQSAVYAGGHNMTTVHKHLRHMVIFAGHSLNATG